MSRDVTWHVSTQHEEKDLISIMKVSDSDICIAEDLPIKPLKNRLICFHRNSDNILKVVFISRISPEKNLKYALNILKKTQCQIEFDIYGFVDDEKYWHECLAIIDEIQLNNSLLSVSYLGELQPGEVVDAFLKYDVFFFPSGGENYGHVIAESLIAGTPVLISNKTPWLDLANESLGWDFDLECHGKFVEILEKISQMTIEERNFMRIDIVNFMNDFLLSSDNLENNKKMYRRGITSYG